MQHIFDIDIAEEYGILEAVLLNHFEFWIKKNMANGKHFHDGCYWTYNSVKAFGDLFPYASAKQIRGALNHLIEEGLIQTGNYNELPTDRTLWYSFTEVGMCLLQKGQMDLPCRENGFASEGKALPDINTDIEYKNTYKDTYNPPFNPPKGDKADKPKNTKNSGTLSTEFLMEEVKAKNFSPAVVSILGEWIEYKKEIKTPYKSATGFQKLLTKLKNEIQKRGEKAVVERIEEAMSRQWVGWNFDTMDAFDKNRPYMQNKQKLETKSRYKDLSQKPDDTEQRKQFQELARNLRESLKNRQE